MLTANCVSCKMFSWSSSAWIERPWIDFPCSPTTALPAASGLANVTMAYASERGPWTFTDVCSKSNQRTPILETQV